jgi:hypothetical protein
MSLDEVSVVAKAPSPRSLIFGQDRTSCLIGLFPKVERQSLLISNSPNVQAGRVLARWPNKIRLIEEGSLQYGLNRIVVSVSGLGMYPLPAMRRR